MLTSTQTLADLLAELTDAARARGLNDSAWASGAGFSKETLSRLRRRESCDLSTLLALAAAAGVSLSVTKPAEQIADDGQFPGELSRAYEQRLLSLCGSGTLDPTAWREMGAAVFMAGLAVMLASDSHFDRRDYLALAEKLHPSATEVRVFAEWLKRTPLRPSRFLPMLMMELKHAA